MQSVNNTKLKTINHRCEYEFDLIKQDHFSSFDFWVDSEAWYIVLVVTNTSQPCYLGVVVSEGSNPSRPIFVSY